ncbi:MFS family permease [Rhodobium orientis]|uniref:MFS transporter n=1 Tax=Rhodobium orientis TaxID=34017 RepID=A0A327JLV1_9HYPH|nr:MFS transporter [Rhodobium orientis]MBB4304812.1 MFS family permease [Rhodobium orientis]MBK5948014.1 MFS transporter [Rhodobium orientis]RAI27450.1 MFS transporter [Rhodobium orientis]
MTTLADHTHIDDGLARHNARVLATAQAFGGANSTIVIAASSLAAHYLLGSDKSLATVPVTTFVFGVALATIPVQLLSRRIGRKPTFLIGALFGICAGLISARAVFVGSFELLCLGTAFSGVYNGFAQAYRFAAADSASDAFRPKAISWVLVGGVVAAVLGPQVVIYTRDLFAPIAFAGAFVGQSVIGAVALLILTFFREPPRPVTTSKTGGRPLIQIVSQSRFIVAVLCGITSYALMSFVMTAAPLAMVACNHSADVAALGIQWHVIAMFGPSFFTGSLINRFGVERVIGLGLVLLAGCSIVALSGVDVAHFWIALVLLGVGWNFGFVGATTMVTATYRLDERNKVQAANDFLVFGFQAVASFTSGAMLARFGWDTINWSVFPFVVVALATLIWLHFARSDAA